MTTSMDTSTSTDTIMGMAINTMARMGMIMAMVINMGMAANMGTTTATNTTAIQKINTDIKACPKVD